MAVSVQQSWIDAFADKLKRKKIRESSIESAIIELTRLRVKYKIDLVTVTREDLIKHLNEYVREHKQNGYRLHVIRIRQALKFLGRKELLEHVEMPQRGDPAETVQVLTGEEQMKLIHEAPTATARLAFELLIELGGRRMEVCTIRIKDVQFDEYGAIIRLEGKTGVRRRRIYNFVPDLRTYLNAHPHNNQPNWPLLVKENGEGYTGRGFYAIIRRLGWKILNKGITPHMFRHTRATEDSRFFTDQEMKKLFGWSSTSMVAVYSHLSMRDVEEKDLVLHGMKRKEEILRPLAQVIKCGACGQADNAPIAIFCNNCGATLTNGASQDPDEVQSLRTELKEVHEMVRALQAASGYRVVPVSEK